MSLGAQARVWQSRLSVPRTTWVWALELDLAESVDGSAWRTASTEQQPLSWSSSAFNILNDSHTVHTIFTCC
jgi:hypothetical protein